MIEANEVRDLVHYDPDTGIMRWPGGKQVGTITNVGYRQVTIQGKKYQASRLAFAYMTEKWPEFMDHINHNKSDDRWVNLRDVSHSTNMKNLSTRQSNKSGYNGVRWHESRKKWQVQVGYNGSTKHVGYYPKLEDAISARKVAEKRLGFHNNHGMKQ